MSVKKPSSTCDRRDKSSELLRLYSYESFRIEARENNRAAFPRISAESLAAGASEAYGARSNKGSGRVQPNKRNRQGFGNVCGILRGVKEPLRTGDRSDKSTLPGIPPDIDWYICKRDARAAIQQLASRILDPSTTDGDRSSAAWSLHSLTHLSVETLAYIALKYPSVVRPIAETSVVWPAFISRHGDFAKSNDQLIERLNLGARHFFRFTFPSGKRGKRWSMRTPANALAIEMLKNLFALQCTCRSLDRDRRDKRLQEIYRRSGFQPSETSFLKRKLFYKILRLEPLSHDTVEEWFNVAWEVLLERTENGHPERHPKFRKLGVHREKHTSTAKLRSKTSESNVRDGIKQRLRTAFGEVVALDI